MNRTYLVFCTMLFLALPDTSYSMGHKISFSSSNSGRRLINCLCDIGGKFPLGSNVGVYHLPLEKKSFGITCQYWDDLMVRMDYDHELIDASKCTKDDLGNDTLQVQSCEQYKDVSGIIRARLSSELSHSKSCNGSLHCDRGPIPAKEGQFHFDNSLGGMSYFAPQSTYVESIYFLPVTYKEDSGYHETLVSGFFEYSYIEPFNEQTGGQLWVSCARQYWYYPQTCLSDRLIIKKRPATTIEYRALTFLHRLTK